MANILLVEDDEAVRSVVSAVLKMDGHQVALAGDGASGLASAAANAFDLFLLDVSLPGGVSGLDLAANLRQRQSAPIIMVTARDTEGDVLTGLAMGADTYLTKPFSPAILAATVRAALRRLPAAESAPEVDDGITVGGLRLDPAQWQIFLDGQPVPLTAREFKLVAFLLRHPNRVVDRDTLIERVWGDDFDGSDRVVDVSLSRLRRQLFDQPACPVTVKAVPGVGYKLVTKT